MCNGRLILAIDILAIEKKRDACQSNEKLIIIRSWKPTSFFRRGASM